MHTPDSTNSDDPAQDGFAKDDPLAKPVCDTCIHRTLCVYQTCEACVHFKRMSRQPFYEKKQYCVLHHEGKCRFTCFRQQIKRRVILVRTTCWS